MQEMRVGLQDQNIEVLLVEQSKLSRGEKMSKVGRHRRNSSTISRVNNHVKSFTYKYHKKKIFKKVYRVEFSDLI